MTGASSGIGAALARELSRQGARLVLAARRVERLEALASELGGAGRALAVACDVTRDGDTQAAVARGVEAFGRLDVAVANAGFGVVGDFRDLSLEDFRRQYETNVFGLLRTCRAAIPHLERTRGRLGLVGSIAGYFAAPGASPYCSSKAAVGAIAGCLRHELRASGVSVTLFCPGFVESEIAQVDNLGRHHPGAAEGRPRRLIVPASSAARSMARALARRRGIAVITVHGRAVVFLQRHAPWFMDLLARRGLRARRAPAGS